MALTANESKANDRSAVPARVDTIESDGKMQDAKVINLRDPSDSIWLRHHLIWATHNNAQVVVSQPII